MSDTKAVMATLIAGAALAGAAHATSAPSSSVASPALQPAVVEPQMLLEPRKENRRKPGAPSLSEPGASTPEVWLARRQEVSRKN